jgi:carbon monoxide dehydrogenase subunit G
VKFEQSIDLDADPQRVWDFVMDVPSVAKCIPGCDGVEAIGPDKYKAIVKVKVDSADKRIGGAVKATMSMKLTAQGTGTKLDVETDANVMGRIGDFGQPVIRKKADQTLQEVAANLRSALATPV